MDVFRLRDEVVDGYAAYVRSFLTIADPHIKGYVEARLAEGHLWPEALVQLNPAFEPGATIDDLVREGALHPETARVFRRGKDVAPAGEPLRLHRHQGDALRVARTGASYVLTTGTGSGKSLAYFVPIMDDALSNQAPGRVKAIVVYPMNALTNSQMEELERFLQAGYLGRGPVTFERYTGQESQEERERIAATPPDILLTNYAMLELLMTRVDANDRALMRAAEGLRFLALDELHTYRDRQGPDVAMLVRRVRERLNATALRCIRTSATSGNTGRSRKRYAGLIDVAGEEEEGSGPEAFDNAARRDSTALTMVEVDTTGRELPLYQVVDRMACTGAKHAALHAQFEDLARNVWGWSAFVVDATGVGAGLAAFLADSLGNGPKKDVVEPFVFTGASKSQLGWDLAGLIDGGRTKEYADNGDEITRVYRQQLAACAYEVLPGQGRLLRWGVPARRRHDDLLISTALTARLDVVDWRTRTARGVSVKTEQRPWLNACAGSLALLSGFRRSRRLHEVRVEDKEPQNESGRRWGVDPTLVTFFIPLLDPVGLIHGSTFTIRRDEEVPWLVGTPMAAVEGLEPAIMDDDGRGFVSLMVWRPKEPIMIPSRHADAMMNVFAAVTGEVEAKPIDELFRGTDLLGETAGTVITAVTPMVRSAGEPFLPVLGEAFNRCLEELNSLVRAYVTTAGLHDTRLISRRNVFPSVLFRLRDPFGDEGERYSGLMVVHEGVNWGVSGPGKELGAEESAKIATGLSRIKQGDPLQAASEQYYRARRAFWFDGDYAATVSAAYTGGEVLLNSLLLLLEWEKGRPRESTRRWFEEQGLVKRLRCYYHGMLGGNWDPNNPNRPIGKFMALAELRGRVVHAGYWPTEAEAEWALDIMDELADFVKERLASKAEEYPRTALLLLGRPGLERLGAWRRVERFFEDVAGGEDPWIASFQAWLAA